MGKKSRKPQIQETPPPKPASLKGLWMLGLTNLVGILVLVAVSVASWQAIGRMKLDMDAKLTRIESRVGRITKDVEAAVAKVGQKPRRGPDPNRVYKFKTAGAPSIGPGNAPVTIVEFSDFQ